MSNIFKKSSSSLFNSGSRRNSLTQSQGEEPSGLEIPQTTSSHSPSLSSNNNNNVINHSGNSDIKKSHSGVNISSGIGYNANEPLQEIELEPIGGSSLKKSQSVESVHSLISEPQIPLYYSMVKENERRRELKIRKRIKNRFGKKAKKDKSVTSPTATVEPIETPTSPKENDVVIKDLDLQPTLTTDHSISIEDLASKYNTFINTLNPKNSNGLSQQEAKFRLERDGPNALTPAKPIPNWLKYLKEYVGLFPLMLEIGAILSFMAYGLDRQAGQDNLYLGIILVFVVVTTCTFSYLQESKSSSVMDGFKLLTNSTARVCRDGNLFEIESTDLVVGDVVHIRAGDKVPADIRIIHSHHFKVDNSSLTGETEPVTRTTECTDENPLETQNLAFYGTLAVIGECVGVVVACGDNTTIGNIALLARKSKPQPTPMKVEINQFIKIITIVALTLGALFIVLGFSRDIKWIYVIIYCISTVVSQVPEGLLPTLTVTLNITAKRMAKKNVMIKSLMKVETFGSATTIASDKTGTLTQNIMTVVHLWYDGTIYSCNSLTASNYYNRNSETFKNIFMVSALCSRTVFDKASMDLPIQQRKTLGDASESALLKFCEQIQSVEAYRERYPKIFEIPFNSVNKWQLSIHSDGDDGPLFMVMKGAPERIIKICNRIMIDGQEMTLDDTYLNNLQASYEYIAGKGERALGMAMLRLNPEIYNMDFPFDIEEKNYPTDGLVFIGMTALMDPPRPGVKEAIQVCKEARVRVMMVTGDHPLTAASIAKQVGIIETEETLNDCAKKQNIDVLDLDFSLYPGSQSIVVPGSRLDDLTHEQWDKILSLRQIVFARTSPEQKLIIVEKCQKRGEIIAMTGDGVNDSPALKKADLGCAMGITGSDVAKEAASIVLLDDNFASIVNGIEEGRIIFDKLKKSLAYCLSSNIPEVLPFLCYFVLHMPVALSGILILCIDLGTDLLPLISYGYEESETDMMKRKPRNTKTDKLFSLKLALFSYAWLGTVQCAAGFLNFFLTFRDYGISASDIFNINVNYFMNESPGDFLGYNREQQMDILREAQTAYFVAVVITRIGAALSCKTRKISIFQQGFKNHVFNIGLISMISLALIIVHVPGIRIFFGCTIISYKYWLLPIPFSVFLVSVNEWRLYMARTYPKSIFKRWLSW
ncbi:P-type ATPase [Tieghemostelium lacteum]|uniref:P-type ATPase n=1 Tax=Tieghemostelium lacteum TaxID=361077 RepID=A0A151Z600_TIELA|nr:P-type ATPase [Tieghemostelium lacteum]|eukprot:KYQ89383.1 P-type ATPase [Tieghemostelium lacteum]